MESLTDEVASGFPNRRAATGPRWRIAAGLFLLSLCVVQLLIRDRFRLFIDEGIFLEGSALVARGQAPYRDFFNFTGPGAFWLHGAVFYVFGASLMNARLVLSAEIALMCTAIYWVLSAMTRTSFAVITGLLFVTLCLDSPYALYVNHRWDSNTWAMAALVLAYNGSTQARRSYWIASGACAAIAAWITPPFFYVAALLAVSIGWSTGWRRAGEYLLGLAGLSTVAAGVLLYQGAFLKMIEQLLWATSHYTAPNKVPYGYLTGHPLATILGMHGLRSLLPLGRMIEALIPALLPILAYLGLVVCLFLRRSVLTRNKKTLALLVAFSAGVLLAGLPRLGAHQLLFLSPVFWILCGYFLYNGAAPRWRSPLIVGLALTSCALLISGVRQDRRFTEPVETNAGEVRCTPADARLISALQSKITPGADVFIFPYLPIVYFLTGGVNPSRYLFLQPGMMSGEDEAAALAELRAREPQWMLRAQFPRNFWMDTWPNTDPSRLSFRLLESYMQANYQEVLRIKMVGESKGDGDPQALVLGCEARSCGKNLSPFSPPGGALR